MVEGGIVVCMSPYLFSVSSEVLSINHGFTVA